MYFSKRKKTVGLVILIGPEGAGKSTQAKLLLRWLQRNHKKSKFVEIKSHHLLAYVFVKLMMWLGRSSSYPYPNCAYKWLDPDILRALQKLWFTLELISILLLTLIRVYIPFWFGYVVICEGGLPYTYAYLSNAIDFFKLELDCRSIMLLLRFIPNNSRIIILDANYDVLLERYTKRGTYAEPIRVIEFQKNSFDFFMHHYKAHYVDTSRRAPSEIFKEIQKYVWS